jgi:hypothetical protein
MKYKTPILSLTIAAAISFSFFTPVVYATTMTALSIPAPLITYVSQHPGYGCVSGTLNPFTITSTTCPRGTNTVANGLVAYIAPITGGVTPPASNSTARCFNIR